MQTHDARAEYFTKKRLDEDVGRNSFVMGHQDGSSSVHKYASSTAGTVANSSDAREGCISCALHCHGSSIGPTVAREVGATHLQHVA